MRSLAFGALITAWLVGCHPTQESDTDGVCTVVCRCFSPLPGEQQQCVAECEKQEMASDACAECVYERETSCSELLGTCQSLCNPPQPQPGGI
jgi:hypothetical protein